MYSSQLSNVSSFTLNFILHVIKLFYFNPQRLMRLHLDGDYIPIFPIGFFGFSYQAAAQKRFNPILTFFKSNSTLFFLILGYIVVM